MKRFRILAVALFAIFALGVVASAPAMAATLCVPKTGAGLFETQVSETECSKEVAAGKSAFELVTFLLAEWLVTGGVVVSTELLTETTGELLLEDTKVPLLGKAVVLCSGILDGWVGPNSLDWVSEVLTLSPNEVVNTTPLTGVAAACVNVENCEEPLLWAVHLGWETEVELLEEDGGPFFVNLILPHGTGTGINPGWEIECMKSIIGAITDECTAAEAGAELTLEGTTLLGNFSEAFNELAGLKLGNCTLGGTETGVVEGGGIIALNGGGELTASSEGVIS